MAKTSAVCKSRLIWGDPFEMTRCFTLVKYDHLHRKETNSLLFMVFLCDQIWSFKHVCCPFFTLVSIVLHRYLWWPWRNQGFFGPIPRTSIESTRCRWSRGMDATSQWLQDEVTKRDTTSRRYICTVLYCSIFDHSRRSRPQWIKVRYLSFRKCRDSVICASHSPECQHLSEARTKAVTVTCPNWQRPGQQCDGDDMMFFFSLGGEHVRSCSAMLVMLEGSSERYGTYSLRICDLWFKPLCGKIVRDISHGSFTSKYAQTDAPMRGFGPNAVPCAALGQWYADMCLFEIDLRTVEEDNGTPTTSCTWPHWSNIPGVCRTRIEREIGQAARKAKQKWSFRV